MNRFIISLALLLLVCYTEVAKCDLIQDEIQILDVSDPILVIFAKRYRNGSFDSVIPIETYSDDNPAADFRHFKFKSTNVSSMTTSVSRDLTEDAAGTVSDSFFLRVEKNSEWNEVIFDSGDTPHVPFADHILPPFREDGSYQPVFQSFYADGTVADTYYVASDREVGGGPEIDPSSMVSALTLLGAGVMMLTARRHRSRSSLSTSAAVG